MNRTLKQLAVVLPLMALAVYFLPAAPAALAQLGGGTQILPEQISQATGGATDFITLVRRIIDYFLGFLGIICVAMIIYGGFLFVTAGANEENAAKGKKILTYAGIGIVVILLSFVVVNALLQAGQGSQPT
jgi:hypothetical protein